MKPSRGDANTIGGVFILGSKQSLRLRRGLTVWYLILAISLTSGCNGNENRTDLDAHYDNDGYMGTTNTNPSLLTSPNSHTYSADMEMMKLALANVSGIRQSAIVINGSSATVRIQVEQHFQDTDIRKIRDEAQRKLSFMVPRYDVEVTAYQ